MYLRTWVGLLVGAFLGLATLGASTAQAQEPRVVVMDFTGKGGSVARMNVLRGLRGNVVFDKRDNGLDVLRRTGQKVSSVRGRKAIAETLGLDYVLWGRVRGRGVSARTEIRIAGPDGAQISAYEAGPPGQKEGNQTIRQASLAALQDAVQAVPPEASEAAAEDASFDNRNPYGDDTKKKRKKRNRKKTAGEVPIATILGGAGGRIRNITVNVDNGAGGTAAQKFESGLYFDIALRLELRPLARSDKAALRGIAFEVDAGFGIGLKAQPAGSAVKLNTKTWRLLAQAGYLHTAGIAEVGGLFGFGIDSFGIDDNGTMPSIKYLFLRFGPAVRFNIVDRKFYVRLDAGLRLPLSYGELSDTFGDTKGIGFDGVLTLGGQIDSGFSYALRTSLEMYRPKFSAFAGGAVPAVPAAAQGVDGSDLGITFSALVGWSF